jgi:uncharacterized delta-60 repeat protein
VAAGYTEHGSREMALVRYTEDGDVDPAFGGQGIVRTNVNGWSEADAVAVLPDGSIVAGGQSAGSPRSTLVRYTGDGDLVTTFGTAGVAFTDWGRGWSDIHALAVNAAGTRVVAAGSADSSMAAMRHEITPLGGAVVDEPVVDKDDETPPIKEEQRREESKPVVTPPSPAVQPVVPKVTSRSTVAPRRCSSRRLFRLTPRRLGLRGAKVVASGKKGRRAAIKARGGSVTIDLRRLPAGTYTVQVRGRTASGARRTIAKTYRTCA